MDINLRSVLLSLVWVTPFVAFIAGYQFIRLVTHTETVYVPTVVGLHLTDAIRLLSADQLNVRILAEKEDPDLHNGTILSQTPEQGQLVKPHQSVFLVISRKPLNPLAPKVVGSTCTQAQRKVRRSNLSLKIYPLESSYPKDRCIGQSVVHGKEVKGGRFTIYCSQGATPLRIVPNLKRRSVDEVISFFGLYDIPVKIQGERKGRVLEQQPLAGTLIDIRKPLVVELTTSG